MKKTYFVLIALLLAMVMVSCDSITQPKGDLPVIAGYTDDGRAIMEVSIGGVEVGRSLIASEARNYSTYYEVVFRRDGTPNDSYHRLSWRGTNTARIKLPIGQYDGTDGDAVLFVGTDDNKTLLAIGTILEVVNTVGGNPTTVAGAVVTTTTTKITFTLAALQAEIDYDDYSTSPFKITGSTQTDFPAGITLAAVPIPVFEVGTKGIPVPATAVTATYTIDLNHTSLNDWADYAGLIKVKANGTVKASPVKVDDDKQQVALGATPTVTGLSAGADFDGTFGFSFLPQGGKSGLCQISFEVPVYAINTAAASPENWFIRGGIYNGDIDDGSLDAAEGGINGSIVLGIGDYDQSRSSGIEIDF